MIEINSIILLITFIWTIFQQYKINSMCEKCPFRSGDYEKKKKNKVTA